MPTVGTRIYKLDTNTRVWSEVSEKASLHFIQHRDGGHSWLEVQKNVLEKFNILEKISEFSRFQGQKYYLEEDVDAGILVEALCEKGIQFTTSTIEYIDCFVRGLPRVNTN